MEVPIDDLAVGDDEQDPLPRRPVLAHGLVENDVVENRFVERDREHLFGPEADGVVELLRVADTFDLEDANADPVVREPEPDSALGQLVELEEALQRDAERLGVPDLAGHDDARLERLAEDIDELRGAVVDDLRSNDLGGADLEADDALRLSVLRAPIISGRPLLRLLRLLRPSLAAPESERPATLPSRLGRGERGLGGRILDRRLPVHRRRIRGGELGLRRPGLCRLRPRLERSLEYGGLRSSRLLSRLFVARPRARREHGRVRFDGCLGRRVPGGACARRLVLVRGLRRLRLPGLVRALLGHRRLLDGATLLDGEMVSGRARRGRLELVVRCVGRQPIERAAVELRLDVVALQRPVFVSWPQGEHVRRSLRA